MSFLCLVLSSSQVTVDSGKSVVWKANAFVKGVAGFVAGAVVDGAVTFEVGSGVYDLSASL